MNNNWELYSTHRKFAAATRALDEAWQEAKSLVPDWPSKQRAYLAEQHVYAVMKKYADVGATDTEPVWHLRDLVREHFGTEGGWL